MVKFSIRFVCIVWLSLFTMSAFAKDRIETYSVFTVNCSGPKQVQILSDANVILMGEDVLIGENQVAVRFGEELSVAAIPLPSKFLRIYRTSISEGVSDGGPNYRTEWLNLDQINAEWETLRATYPWLVSRKSIGTSHEGRTIWAYRVFRPELRDVLTPPKSVLILGNTHAREWMSPSVVLHLGIKLTELLATTDDLLTDQLVDSVGTYFVPVMNPDGYFRSWNGERFWRKNRRNNGGGVFGVDLNRNYEKAWGGAGSSGTTSSDTYRGPSPASEPELQAVRNYALTLRNLIAFVDYHSYAGDILYPWSYTTAPAPPAAVTMFQSVGAPIRSAIIAAGGPTYTLGQGSVVLYLAAGSSKDWFYDRFNVPSYTIEIFGTQFDPPATTITPTQDHSWAGFKAFLDAAIP